jgi:hypothetical protein
MSIPPSASPATLSPMAAPLRPVRRVPAEFRRVVRAETRAHQLLRDRLVVLAVVTLVLWLAASAAMYFFERHAQGTDIHNPWLAAYWTASQMSTVGSNFANPRSTPAYVLDVVLKIYAVVVVGSVAGAVGAFFVHRKDQEASA